MTAPLLRAVCRASGGRVPRCSQHARLMACVPLPVPAGQDAPDEAYRRFDELAKRHVETLRRLTQQIQVGSGFEGL